MYIELTYLAVTYLKVQSPFLPLTDSCNARHKSQINIGFPMLLLFKHIFSLTPCPKCRKSVVDLTQFAFRANTREWDLLHCCCCCCCCCFTFEYSAVVGIFSGPVGKTLAFWRSYCSCFISYALPTYSVETIRICILSESMFMFHTKATAKKKNKKFGTWLKMNRAQHFVLMFCVCGFCVCVR